MMYMDMEIKHRSGKVNLSADALSRNPDVEASYVEVVGAEFATQQYIDPDFKAIIDYLKTGIYLLMTRRHER